MASIRRPRLIYVLTHPASARLLLRGQLRQMSEWGFDVTVIAGSGPELERVARDEGVRVFSVKMSREPQPLADLATLLKLVRLFRSLRPDIVNASTPKAGLLGMLAAKLTRVPIRIYLLRGLRAETERGTRRRVLLTTERITALAAHQVVCVSRSLRDAYVRLGLAPLEQCAVLAQGSSNGVDPERFCVTPSRAEQAKALRARIGLGDDEVLFGFVGRPVADKGIEPLLTAFQRLPKTGRPAKLLLVGAALAGDTASAEFRQRCGEIGNVHLHEYVEDLAPYYAAIDALVLPSFREGFPNAPLEAAAAGKPCIGFGATGVVDAIVPERTGLIVKLGDVDGLTRALVRYRDDEALRVEHGRAAAARVMAEFTQTSVWQAWREEYLRWLELRGLELTEPQGVLAARGRV